MAMYIALRLDLLGSLEARDGCMTYNKVLAKQILYVYHVEYLRKLSKGGLTKLVHVLSVFILIIPSWSLDAR